MRIADPHMVPVRFGPQVAADLDAGSAREWLLADGTGGFAMGTVSGMRTRRYHGLLVVAGDPPAARRMGLVSLDPVLVSDGGAEVRLSTHEWTDGTLAPAGHELLASFDLDDGVPRWRWRIGNVVVEREIAMTPGRPCVAVVLRLLAGGPVTLGVDALVTWRDAHGERHADGPAPVVTAVPDGVVVEDAYRVVGPGWKGTGEWWRGVHHRVEAARGLAAEEDLWYAGRFHAALEHPGDVVELVAYADSTDGPSPRALDVVAAARTRAREIAAAGAARAADGVDPAVAGSLAVAADTFVIRHRDPDSGSGAAPATGRPDVVAGYPWFGTWSRDTMTSYPGLFLATGREDLGRELLRGYASTLSGGMLANTADTGELRYNTVDGTLWFAYAVERHVLATGDTDLAAELAPALRDVIAAHLTGVRYGIHATDDGLLTQGADGEALTWMDARVDGVPVTPRVGKTVEVNALWCNALAAVAELSRRAGQATTVGDGRDLDRLAAAARAAFAGRFPLPDGTLADIVDGPDPTAASKLRPNQLLAWSLPYAPLTPDPSVLSRLDTALLTPLGPRSLDPADPDYRGRHEGDPADRDHAYHEGTVWPWMVGPWADAWRRSGTAAGRSDVDGSAAVAAMIDGVGAHLTEYGLGSVSETTDGDCPHVGTGCPAQAWSVAEALRIATAQASS